MAAFEHIRCSPVPELRAEEMSESDMNVLLLSTMDALDAFYLDPENARRRDEWKANGGMEKFEEEVRIYREQRGLSKGVRQNEPEKRKV